MTDLRLGDCREVMREIPDDSIDAIVTDPPYAEIDRAYGRLTEAEWWELIVEGVIPQCRRVLKPNGSAVFIVQPNSRKVGSLRGWVFRFQVWACDHWNIVQDSYWWNFTAAPTVHCQERHGLMRPSVKPCVWLGDPDCYRNQSEVLWKESDATKAQRMETRSGKGYRPSGLWMDTRRCLDASLERGGVTPFNITPISSGASTDSSGSHGHGAGTPAALANWWIRYLCPPGGTILDPFNGAGTMTIEAKKLGFNAIGIERDPEYHAIALSRLSTTSADHPLFPGIHSCVSSPSSPAPAASSCRP